MIEIVIPTHKNIDAVIQMISCLKLQFDARWKAHIVVDGNLGLSDAIQDYIMTLIDDRFRVSNIEGPNNDWGHTAREYGLKNATEEWVIMTGDDNYYMPSFIDEFIKAIKDNPDSNFIYCDMLHNQYDYSHFKVTPNFNQIDIGGFACKTEIAKNIPMEKTYAADGLFVEEYKKRGVFNPTKVDKILYIHN